MTLQISLASSHPMYTRTFMFLEMEYGGHGLSGQVPDLKAP